MKRIMVSVATTLFLAIASISAGIMPAIASAAPSNSEGTYAALGDSVAAGLGLQPSNTNPSDALCGRSSLAYPYIVAAARNLRLNNATCTGAEVNQGLYGSQLAGSTTLPPQIDQAFAAGSPKLMTITIGANDVGWNELLSKCYTAGCGSAQDGQTVNAALLRLRFRLAVALADIQWQSGNKPPKVLLTGYYRALSNAQPVCADTALLNPTEITWINHEESKLNAVIRQSATEFSFAHYMPLNFAGHELCSSDPWMQGIQSAAPFHPTADGQAAIAKSILVADHH